MESEKDFFPRYLRCEYKIDPLGMDSEKPRLSWNIDYPPGLKGKRQSAYQILVSEEIENIKQNIGECWDSGKIFSEETSQIEYSGEKLKTLTEYFWKVKIWDDAGNSSSEWSEHCKMGNRNS